MSAHMVITWSLYPYLSAKDKQQSKN